MKDLIEQLDNILAEGKVEPGDKRAISFRINKLEKFKRKLTDYRGSLNNLRYSTMPPELQDEHNALVKKMEDFVSQIEKELHDLELKYEDNGEVPMKLDKLFKGIEKNCSQIVKIYKQLNSSNFSTNRFIFRGIRSDQDALYSLPFTNRRPKDSREEVDKLADAALKNHGYEAARSNSVFTTGSYSQASGYGHNVYIIFPFDGFHFTYSKTIGDLILRDDYLIYFVNESVREKIVELLEKAYDDTDTVPNPLTSQFYNGKSGIQELFTRAAYGNEDKNTIRNLISNSSFKQSDELANLFDQLYTDDTKFMEHMKFVNDDIYSAITSHNEIYLNSKFYAIKYSSHIDAVKKLLEKADISGTEIPERFGEAPDRVFGEGEIVEFVKGDHKGKLGVIQNASKLTTLTISTEYSGTTLYDIPASDITLYDDPEKFKFEIGDRVIITTEGLPMYGHSGEVTDISTSDNYIRVKFETGYSSRYYVIQAIKETPETLEYYADKKSELLPIGEKVVVIDKQSPYYKYEGEVRNYNASGRIEVSFTQMGTIQSFSMSKIIKSSEFTGKISPPVTRYITVKILAGKNKGKIGKVTSIYSDGDLYLEFEDGTSDSALLKDVRATVKKPKTDLKLLHNQDIVVGDLVRVTGSTSSFVGNEGIVLLIDPDNFSDVAAKVARPDKSEFWTKVSSLTKLGVIDKNDKIIKIGDTVKTSTKEGEVKNFGYSKTGNIIVNLTDGNEDYKVSYDKLEIVDSSDKIKTGDYVKIVSSASSFNGEVGQVLSIKSSKEIEVKINSVPSTLIFSKNELKKDMPDEDSKESLQKGDRFRVKDTGQKGTVINIIGYSDPLVILDERNDYPKNIPLYLLEKIDEPEKTFKIGDMVSVKKPNYSVKKGTIVNDIDGDGEYRVSYPDGDAEYARPMHMRKVDKYAEYELKKGDYAEVVSSDFGYEGLVGEVSYVNTDTQFVELTFPNGEVQEFDKDVLEKTDPPEDRQDKEDDISDLEVNDKVIVTKGDYAGTEGIINFIWHHGGIDITVEPTGTEISVADASYLKKKVAVNSDFAVGDQVKIKSGLMVGKVGKVIGSTEDSITVEFTHVPGYSATYSLDQIEKIDKALKTEPASELKVGDRVKVVKTDSVGKTGVITEINPKSNWPYRVKYDNSEPDSSFNTAIFSADEIELIPANSDIGQTDELKVGDKVQTVTGLTGEIINITPVDPYPYTVKFEKENGQTDTSIYELEELIVLPKSGNTTPGINETGFKVDDLVYINGNNYLPNNTLGQITYVGKTSCEVKILEGLSTSAVYDIPNDELTIVPPYQEGDTVMVINDKLETYGKQGVVQQISGNMLSLTTSSGPAFVQKTSVKKVPDEQNTENTTQSNDQIEDGDSVEIVDNNSPWHGKKGIAVYAGEVYADVAFTTDYADTLTIFKSQLKKLPYKVDLPDQLEMGDTVEVIDPEHAYYKKAFTVSDISGQVVYIETDDVFTTAGADQLKKIS